MLNTHLGKFNSGLGIGDQNLLYLNPLIILKAYETITHFSMRHHNHQYPSPEKLSNITLILRDVIIGFADGLTVPFALTAGLSSLGSSKLVVIGGLAELLSGTISMGMGAYLAVITERDRYIGQEMLLRKSVSCRPEDERTGIIETLNGYGISREAGESVIACLVPEDILTKVNEWYL